ncbi:MAG TPA: hypothetical protein VMT76_15560 [Puia sp.]|nr:hypothetical protein [Puia sp.]
MKKTKTVLFTTVVIFLALMALWIFYVLENIETKNMDEAARKNVPGKFAAHYSGLVNKVILVDPVF